MAEQQVQEIIDAFKELNCDNDVRAFVERFGFREARTKRRQQYLAASLVVGGDELVVSCRWYDPSGPFQNIPDENRAELFLAGRLVVSFDLTDD